MRPETEFGGLANRFASATDAYLHSLHKLMESKAIEPEDVHAGRTNGRRLAVALEILATILPAQHAKLLKNIRRRTHALGELRDGDIVSSRIAECRGRTADQIVRQLNKRRRKRERHVRSAVRKLIDGKAAGRISRFKDSQWILDLLASQRLGSRQFLREKLAPIVNKFTNLCAGISPQADDALLHGLRKAVKRVRYAFELTLPEMKTASALVKRCKSLQDVLGDLHDTLTAVEEARRPSDRRQSGKRSREALQQKLQRTLHTMRKQFLRKWVPKRLRKLERDIRKTAQFPDLPPSPHK